MNVPLLSIVLTTRNRASRLQELLFSLLPQATDDVEVVVVDGASEDHTTAVLKDMKARGLPLRFHTLKDNGGMDLDFIRAADLATGGHIWFMGDDDIFNPGAVEEVLSEIKQNNPSLIVVNYEVADFSLSEVIDDNRLQVVESEHRKHAEPDEIFSRFGYAMSYIGTTVVARDVWGSFESEKFIGSYFIHLGAAFTSSLSRGVSIIGMRAVRNRTGDASWQKNSFTIWNEKWPLLVSKLSSLSDSYRVRFVADWRRTELRRLLWMKAIGVADDANLARYYESHPRTTIRENLTRQILRTPKMVLVIAAVLKLSVESLILGRNVSWAFHELSPKTPKVKSESTF